MDDQRLVVQVERDDATRLAVVGTGDPWPRRLATAHGDLDERGDEEQAAVSPDGTEVAYRFWVRGDLNRTEIRVAKLDGGEVRALTGTPRMQDGEPAWSPDGATDRLRPLSAAASTSCTWWAATAPASASSRARAPTTRRPNHPDGSRLVAVCGSRNRHHLVVVDAADGTAETLAEGGAWACPHWTASGELVAAYHDHATAPELRLGAPPATRHAPAPRSVRTAPYAALEEIAFHSFDGLEIPGFLHRIRRPGWDRWRQHGRREAGIALRARDDRGEIGDIDGDEVQRQPPGFEHGAAFEDPGARLDLGERRRIQVRRQDRDTTGQAVGRPDLLPGDVVGGLVEVEERRQREGPDGRRGHEHEEHRAGTPARGRAAHRQDRDQVAPPPGETAQEADRDRQAAERG